MIATVVVGLIGFGCLFMALYVSLGQSYGIIFHCNSDREKHITIFILYVFSMSCSMISCVPENINRDVLSHK